MDPPLHDSDSNCVFVSDADLLHESALAKTSLASSTTLCPVVELQAATEDFPREMKFKSPPGAGMLELCIVDSIMPSPRFLQSMTHDQSATPPPSSIQFEDEMVLQAGSYTPSVSNPMPLLQAVHKKQTPMSPPPVAKEVATTPINSVQGAWKVPLKISDPAIPILRYNTESLISEFDSQWPSLANGAQTHSRKLKSLPTAAAGKNYYASLDLDNGLQSPEYPWAAKMNPSQRNLHRVTTPSFMEDGTPKVCIPKRVLLEGVENQKEFIIGQFYRCAAPTGGQIHAVMSMIWGKRCRIFTRKLGENSFLFHIPDESTRQWILQRGLWHVDDCLMFVSSWNPAGNIYIPEIRTIPVWLTLKNIPNQLYSIKGISWIGSGLGAPMLTSRPWLDPTQMGEAKILMEVKLDKPFPTKVAIEDESGSISLVDVLYSWLPSKCAKCGQLGHKATSCLGDILPSKQHDKPCTSSDGNNDMLAQTTSLTTSKATYSMEAISAPAQASDSPKVTIGSQVSSIVATHDEVSAVQNIESFCSTKAVSTAPVHPTSTEVISIPEKIETILITAATSEAGNISENSASQFVATTNSGDMSPHASYDDFSTLQGDTLTLETPVVTDAEDDRSVRRSLDSDTLLDKDDCIFHGNESDQMEASQDKDPLNVSIMRTQRGRPIKPSQKVQEMEWTTVMGKRGRRGRGGSYG